MEEVVQISHRLLFPEDKHPFVGDASSQRGSDSEAEWSGNMLRVVEHHVPRPNGQEVTAYLATKSVLVVDDRNMARR